MDLFCFFYVGMMIYFTFMTVFLRYFFLQDAPAVEYLIQAYPSYVSVDSLPLAKASTEEKVAYISQYICILVSIDIDSAPRWSCATHCSAKDFCWFETNVCSVMRIHN